MYGVVAGMDGRRPGGRGGGSEALTGGTMGRPSRGAKGPVRGHPRPIQEDVTQHILHNVNILPNSQHLLTMGGGAALGPAIVRPKGPTCGVKTYGKSSCQYSRDMGPRRTLIIPSRLSIMARLARQSRLVIWRGATGGD